MKDAHRHAFDYEPRPGYLYVRSRAISSRTNDNFDTFPAEEIRKAWATFKGKPVFVNHHNDNHRRARGVIIDAALHEDTNPDGTPDTWVEVLMEVDAIRYPKLAEAVVKGHIDRTSMGTDVAFSVCSACGNKAYTPLDYCHHIPKMKGKRIERFTASGTKESVLVHEICYGLGFFENSLLVEDPADPTAFTFGVDTRGIQMAAKRIVAEGIHRSAGVRYRLHVRRDCGHSIDMIGSSKDFAPDVGEQVYCGDCGTDSTVTDVEGSERDADPYFRAGTSPYKRERAAALDAFEAALDLNAFESALDAAMTESIREPNWRQMLATMQREALTCAECNPNYGLPDMLCSAHANMRKLQTQWGDDWAIGDFQSGPDSTDILFPGRRAHLAYGEQKAPPEVNTLRDDVCPVCGEEDGFNGSTCQVCGYVQPPKEFQDPDTSKAQEMDLRGGESDTGMTLKCPVCGAVFQTGGEAHAKATTGPDADKDDPNKAQMPDDAEGDVEDDDGPPWKKKTSAFGDRKPDVPPPHSPASDPATENAAKPDDGGDPASNKPGEDSDQNDDTDDTDEAHLSPGDTCPTCGQGQLVEDDLTEFPPDQQTPPAEKPAEDPEDDASGTSLVDKARGTTTSRRKEVGMTTPANPAQEARNRLVAALRGQQQWLASLQTQQDRIEAGLARMAVLAGVEKEPVFAALRSVADLDNAADREAESPIAKDDPTTPGAAPAKANEGVTPAAVTDLSNSNVALPTEPFTDLVDVTAPTPGTDKPPSLEDAKIETEVRVGEPDNSTVAFPIGGEGSGWTAAKGDPQERFMASLRLARLRVQAGLTTESDLVLAQQINDDEATDLATIATEAATLEKVLDNAGAQQRQPVVARRQVPRTVGGQRTAPSLAGGGEAPQGIQRAGSADPGEVQPEEFLFG